MRQRPRLRVRLKAAWFALTGQAVMLNIAVLVQDDRQLWFGIAGGTDATKAVISNNGFRGAEVFYGGQRVPAREITGFRPDDDEDTLIIDGS